MTAMSGVLFKKLRKVGAPQFINSRLMIELELDFDIGCRINESKMLDANDTIVPGHERRTFNDVAQFPDIPWPIVVHKCLNRIPCEMLLDIPPKPARIEEVVCDQSNVAPPLAQRGDLDH